MPKEMLAPCNPWVVEWQILIEAESTTQIRNVNWSVEKKEYEMKKTASHFSEGFLRERALENIEPMSFEEPVVAYKKY